MKKVLLLALIFLSSCATIGQYTYKGSSKDVVISEYVISMPDEENISIPSNGAVPDYWNMSVDKVVEVSNGSDKTKEVIVFCNYIEFSGKQKLTIPPHKTQTMLITTIAKYAYDTLCSIQSSQ